MLRVIIYHPKEFKSINRLTRRCNKILRYYLKVMIVCNDELAQDYVRDHNVSYNYVWRCRVFEPEWKKYPDDAGFITRCLMGRSADALIAFWDGKDSATKQMIEIARRLNLHIKVIDI